MLLDKIFTIDIGTSFTDIERLRHKFITQHKWNKRFYEASGMFVFVPHMGVDCLSPLFELIFSEVSKIDRDINLMSVQDMKEKKHLIHGRGDFSYVLVQNKDRTPFNWHNHFLYGLDELTTGSREWYPFKWATVYYMSMPEGSGGIRFRENDKEILIQPKEGQLIIFPASLYHTPDITTSDDWRISINTNLVDSNIIMKGNRAIRGDISDWDLREKI